MHTAAAEWECGLTEGRRKKLRQGEIHGERERERVRGSWVVDENCEL